jgi:formate-dependent nitrite reductase membrane component NrfD
MSFEEKSTWIMAVISPVACAVYVLNVLTRLEHAPATEVHYAWPMIVSIAAAVVASIVAHIVVSIANPREADRRDERDAHIARFGGHVSGFVLAIACVNVLILAITEVAHFWIANAIYASLVLADVTGSITKIVGYRRGF